MGIFPSRVIPVTQKCVLEWLHCQAPGVRGSALGLVGQFQFQFQFQLKMAFYSLRPVSQQPPQGCPRNSANICLIEHRSFSTLEGGMSAASFLHSSFLQAINAVMLWLVRVEKVPQASEHLCPAKLQTICDICCACQSICPFIPTDSGVPRTVDPQKSL